MHSVHPPLDVVRSATHVGLGRPAIPARGAVPLRCTQCSGESSLHSVHEPGWRMAGSQVMSEEWLFSYGTLRDPDVQRATFGREFKGHPDALVGWRTELLEIRDP